METFIVWIIVGIVTVLLVRKLTRKMNGKESSCSCQNASCASGKCNNDSQYYGQSSSCEGCKCEGRNTN